MINKKQAFDKNPLSKISQIKNKSGKSAKSLMGNQASILGDVIG
ncbi:MAG: hypothetical protein R3D55_18965 [Chloroflexota bacterium]